MALGIDEKVDWFRVIVDLCNCHGYTHATIATAIGAAKSTVQGWKQGASPKFEEGERLLDLWCWATANGRDSVHRVSKYSHRA